MNKKITLYYFLIALIVIITITDPSYAALTAKFDVDKTLAFWTPERIKSAKPLIPENIEFRNETTSGTKNVKITADVDQQQLSMPPFDNTNNPSNYPVGRLFFTVPPTGRLSSCTASMINTENGNIGITAAHCLLNSDGAIYGNMMFSPGYNAALGPLGSIPVEFVIASPGYLQNPHFNDY